MKNKKVLIIATSSRTRGGITAVINAYRQTYFWESWNMVWIETHIDKSFFHKLIYFFRAFIQFIWHIHSADLIHLHFSEPPSAIRKVPFILIIKLLKKKLIVHFHSFSTETTIESKLSFVYKFIFSNANRIIVLSGYWKTAIITKWPQLIKKLVIIYNPCKYIEPINVSKDNLILYAGTLNSRKGYSDLIKAFALISQDHPSWKLAFAGNGEIQKAQLLSRKLGIESQTKFLGWLNGEDKNSIFYKASIFCLPSYAEGFPMSVLDAFSFGLPVVTTPVGGIPDILTHSVNALIFEPGDTKSLSLCLKLLITDFALRNVMAASSLQLASQTFNIDTITQQLNNLYINVISEYTGK